MRSARVNSRQFNRLFTLQEPSTSATKDNLGHLDLSDDDNWTDIGDYYLKMYSQSSREFYRAQQARSDVTHVADVMYSRVTADLTDKMRWFDGTRKLQIAGSFDPDDAREVIQMRLVEKTT